MKPDQVERLLVAMDSAAQNAVGAPNFETACRKAHEVFSYFADELAKIRDREQIRKALLKAEIDPGLQAIFIGACQFAPQLLRSVFTSVADEAKKDLPTATGRPKAFKSAAEALGVCEFVGKLFSHGVQLEIAYSRAAQRFGVSAYTVRRLWKRRAEIASGDAELCFDEIKQATAKLLTD